jgi:hypothetical protein
MDITAPPVWSCVKVAMAPKGWGLLKDGEGRLAHNETLQDGIA